MWWLDPVLVAVLPRAACCSAGPPAVHLEQDRTSGDRLRLIPSPAHGLTRCGTRHADPDPLPDKSRTPEKIEWMIETDGFGARAGAARCHERSPDAGYTYTIGFPAHVGFPDVVVFGLTPVAARAARARRGACARRDRDPDRRRARRPARQRAALPVRPVDLDEWGPLFATAARGTAASRSSSCSSSTPTATASCPTRPASTAPPPVRPAGDRRPIGGAATRSSAPGTLRASISSGPSDGPGNLGERPKVPAARRRDVAGASGNGVRAADDCETSAGDEDEPMSNEALR